MVGGLAAVYLFIFAVLDGLRFPLRGDEVHFWPTTLRFSHSVIPPLEVLRDYGELNTPLPFLVWGALEYALGEGVWVARALNLAVSWSLLAVIVLEANNASTGARAAAGLLIFPYFLFVSVQAYTDVLPAFFAVVGTALYFRERHYLSAFAFALAIAGRQYMVAFPAAISLLEVLRALQRRERMPQRWLAPAAAVATLGGWYLLFGGFGPPGEVAKQGIVTAEMERILPRNALYFLACIGTYFVIPSTVLFRRPLPLSAWKPLRVAGIAAILLALFALFPPVQNENFNIPTMGMLDRVLRPLTGDVGRMLIFYILALLAILRLGRDHVALLLLGINAVLMMKAHIAWDKYALPLVAVLWYLEATGRLSPVAEGTTSGRGHQAAEATAPSSPIGKLYAPG